MGNAVLSGRQEYADTGYGPIDTEHRQVSAVLSELVEATSSGNALTARLALQAAQTLMTRHFAHEERLMRDSGYGNFARHKQAHDTFLADVARQSAKFERNGLSPDFRRWVLGRLLAWFRFHVMANDVELGKYLVSHLTRAKVGTPG